MPPVSQSSRPPRVRHGSSPGEAENEAKLTPCESIELANVPSATKELGDSLAVSLAALHEAGEEFLADGSPVGAEQARFHPVAKDAGLASPNDDEVAEAVGGDLRDAEEGVPRHLGGPDRSQGEIRPARSVDTPRSCCRPVDGSRPVKMRVPSGVTATSDELESVKLTKKRGGRGPPKALKDRADAGKPSQIKVMSPFRLPPREAEFAERLRWSG